MEIGLVFALLTAMTISGSAISTRRGVFQSGEAFSPVVIHITIGTLLFSLLILFTGDWVKLQSLSGQGFALLVTAGIIHFIFGRFLSYTCIRLIGATRGAAIFRTQIFYAVIFGILLFKEPLTLFLVLGVLGIAAGATLAGTQEGSEVAKVRVRGILAGLGGSFFWGISGVLIKPAVEEIGSPSAAAFISFTAAFIVAAGFLLSREQRAKLLRLRRKAFIPFILAGIFNTIGNLFRYTALGYSPVSLVVPITSTSAIFTLLLSFLVNRKIEVFSQKVFWGIAATVVGTLLLFQ